MSINPKEFRDAMIPRRVPRHDEVGGEQSPPPEAAVEDVVITNLRCRTCGASLSPRRSELRNYGDIRFASCACGGLTAVDSIDPFKPTPTPTPTPVTAVSICREAASLVGGDRAVAHGDKTINFQNTADAWNAILRAKARKLGYPAADIGVMSLDALDVANMLEAFKIARRYSGSHNADDYVDGAGYAGCAGEVAARLYPKE